MTHADPLRQTLREIWHPLQSLRRTDWLIGLGSVAMLLVWQVQHRGGFYVRHITPLIPDSHVRNWGLWLWYHGLGLLLLVVIPLAVLRVSGGLRPVQLGFGPADRSVWRLVLQLGLPLALLVGFGGGFDPQLRAEYPLTPLATVNWQLFMLWELTYLIYYIAWEGYFRGILLFGLRGRIGDLGAIFYGTALSCLVHIGKPTGELMASLPAGFIFGALALRAGSMWPVLILHWALGAATDFFCGFRLF